MRYFMINGVDILPYIIEGGIKWQRNDVDGENAGRVLGNADMVRDRLAIKNRVDISLRPLYTQDARMIQQLIEPELVTIQYDDLLFGNVSKVAYSNNATAVLQTVYDEDTDLYTDMTFPLIWQ